MKKISFIIAGCVAIGLFACNKQLNQLPVSVVQTSNFFSNTSDFSQGVNGAYSKLKAYPDQALWMGEVRSDNVTITTDGNRDFQGINDFSPNLTTTGFIVSAWDNDFNGIYNANTVLDALKTKSGNITDSSLAKRFGAECRFLRAFYYFDLLRFYGKLPIINTALGGVEAGAIARSPVSDVYDFIVQDLQYAATNLPGSYTGTDIGRATSWAAKGLLGLVYLTKSGPTYGIDGGPGLASNNYNDALNMFNDIINNGPFVLSSTYPSIFSYTNENNKEVLFDVQYLSGVSAGDFPSMLVPIVYWSGLGYGTTYGNGYGTGTYNVTKNLMQSYRNSAVGVTLDKRDTTNIQHAFALASNAPTVLDTTRPFEKKYINFALRGTSYNDWGINFIVMRYTDIMMMKAECILHGATGTQANVDAIVNQVRSRAGVPTISNVTLPMLMEERRREFVGEGLRWNDLVREGMAVTTMNAWIASDSLTATIKPVIPQYIIYPVPQVEILAKPGLYTQNAGYY